LTLFSATMNDTSWLFRLRLASRAIRHPERAILRLLLHARLAKLDSQADHRRFLAWLSDKFGADAEALDAEYDNSAFRRRYLARLHELRSSVGPRRSGTSGSWSLRALYLLVRAARPHVVVETGVLYGGSSAHILGALAANQEGKLYSIDLRHEAKEPESGFLVPDGLQDRWHLIIGDARRELPILLEQLRAIDCFHHDSLHTFQHMTFEYRTALPHLRPGGVLSSHDVLVAHSLREIFQPNAFPVFCEQQGLQWTTFQNHGFAVLNGGGGVNREMQPGFMSGYLPEPGGGDDARQVS
jgi:predicted O-methyltransferase YrrM